jgi:hypothetical protein
MIKYWLEIKLQYKNERAGFKRKGRMNRKLMMMHICRFVILAKQNQREFDFVNKHIAFRDAILMC